MKVFYVRMENNECVDIKVLASSKKEARDIAQSHSYLCQTSGSNFEVGEISEKPLAIVTEDEETPTEDNPVVLIGTIG